MLSLLKSHVNHFILSIAMVAGGSLSPFSRYEPHVPDELFQLLDNIQKQTNR